MPVVSVFNFFETRATEYSKAATRGNWGEVWENFDRKAEGGERRAGGGRRRRHVLAGGVAGE
ncbi:MAG: hypothetical protein M3N07_03895 [Pseudomonadota bacterium]|nr:hypothetical protein [Pseudomonadota bacterium]